MLLVTKTRLHNCYQIIEINVALLHYCITLMKEATHKHKLIYQFKVLENILANIF